jgi:hypothetical protein
VFATVVPIFDFEGIWWRLFQSLTLRVSDEGYSNLWPWGYLMKVIPIFDLGGTWWMLLQKHVANTIIDILVYDFFIHFFIYLTTSTRKLKSKIVATFIRYPQSQRLEQPSSGTLKVKDCSNLHQVPSKSKIETTFIRYPQSQRL